MFTEPQYWIECSQKWLWWRNRVVAPLSEEWTFRACMLPLLLQCLAPTTAIFVCSLFFGVAHFHHLVENIRSGVDFKTALLRSCAVQLNHAYNYFNLPKSNNFTCHRFPIYLHDGVWSICSIPFCQNRYFSLN